MRGEYQFPPDRHSFHSELPPRARRIRKLGEKAQATDGTTSACAENTHLVAELVREPGNYLRVRGEYMISKGLKFASEELPPRARRIHQG